MNYNKILAVANMVAGTLILATALKSIDKAEYLMGSMFIILGTFSYIHVYDLIRK